MEFALLVDDPGAIDKIAQWHFEEWASAEPGMTVERVVEKLSAFRNRDVAPLMIVARDEGRVVGSAGLKIREMSIYPEFEHWLSGVYVDPECRGQGLASILVEQILARAKSLGVRKLYLQTEDLSGGLYTRHGFESIETVDFKGYRALVMVATV